MIYFCCDSRRREQVRGSDLNGMDYVEVVDEDAPTEAERQRTLLVHFVSDRHLDDLDVDNVMIESLAGEAGARAVKVTSVERRAEDPATVVAVGVDRPGDFSLYVLRLVKDAKHPQPPENFDPMLSSLEFSFKAECPTEFDCRAVRECPPEPSQEPEIDYLAKDYASFRRLMLDRMRVLMPQGRDTSAADLGVTMVEALAYVGDYLSYRQDAIATEAYLGTARLRTSVRRHARLVDYFMHEGCNARAWVQLQVNADSVSVPRGTPLLAGLSKPPRTYAPKSAELDQALDERPAIFETMHEAVLFRNHTMIRFHTWSDSRCCLPKNATRATLRDDVEPRLSLNVGDVLIFEERFGPTTGDEADADPAHRHAVRLTKVHPDTDQVSEVPIVEIEWAFEDRLPFPLCISSVTSADHGEREIADVSVALGNIVLADHGQSLEAEPIGSVPQPSLFRPLRSADSCAPVERVAVPPRFRPRLKERPLTHAAPFEALRSASAALRCDARAALPALHLESRSGETTTIWRPQRDLLASGADATEFVAETEHDAIVRLRFGNNENGRRPVAGTEFIARYRIGCGVAGNVGAESISHVVTADGRVLRARNPMPASGGTDPESVESVRQRAPHEFRRQERAVTEADYAEVSERVDGVQRAAGTFRWTGSWHTAFVTVDREGGSGVDEDFEQDMRTHLERFRVAGQDVEVDTPRFVPLEIEMHVCVAPEHFRSAVKAELLQLFSNRVLPNGRVGVFHPDNFSFGEPVYLSRLYAVAQGVEGVTGVHIKTFQRLATPDPVPVDEGKLVLGRLEIARLDNDPSFPERGVFRLTMGGGK